MQIGSVATAAGIGGGAFFVPLFNILLRFSKLLAATLAMPCLQVSLAVYSMLYGMATPCRMASDKA